MTLLVHDNINTLWHETVVDAESRCAITLDPHLESYLVSLLSRYADKPEMVKRVFATALMQAMEKDEHQRDVLLQQVGDECLLFSGLFPRIVKHKHVNIRYLVNIGRSAYSNITHATDGVFNRLAIQFVMLMDVLQCVRLDNELLPLEAYEQWEAVGSERALQILRRYTQQG